jgi:transposase-like protein
MSQHFLLSSRAKTLTLASVARMSDEEAEAVFRKIRWASNNGDPSCPKCGCTIVYDCRRANGTARWRCKACRHSFSITSGTLFHSRKMPLRAYLLAIAIFCNEVKGKSMLALSRDLGTHYMTAFVLAHKMREAMASEMRGVNVGGEGRKAEIDGDATYGGSVFPVVVNGNVATWTSVAAGLPGGDIDDLWASSVSNVRTDRSPITAWRS